MSYGSRFGHGILVGILLLTPLARAQVTGFSSLELNEEPGRERLWKGEWKFEIGGHKFEEGKDQGAAALLYFTGKFEYSFAWWLKARVTPRVDLFTSRVQERYDNDTYSNRLRLIEGVISIQPFQEVELNAGAINQRHLDSPMLVSGQRSFPGLQQVYQRQFSAFGVELNAQQVVPTSTSLNTEREDEEALPSFRTESLKLGGRHFAWFNWKVRAGHFIWSDLPDKIAFESAISGNRVEGEVAPGARFLSGFEGYFWSGEACYCGTGLIDFTGEYQGLVNTEAPSEYADAAMLGAGPRFHFGDIDLDLRYRSYFIERDATVAVYNRSLLGNTNRIGNSVEFNLVFKDRKFAIVGEWTNARTARNVETQKTMSSWYLGVETEYASF